MGKRLIASESFIMDASRSIITNIMGQGLNRRERSNHGDLYKDRRQRYYIPF